MTSGDNIQGHHGDVEDQALDFLEQWLATGSTQSTPSAPVAPRPQKGSIDVSLRAIERLVTQHRDLFRRHAENR